MITRLSSDEIKAKYKKIRFYYYILLGISLLAFAALYILVTVFPNSFALLKIMSLLLLIGIQVARIFVARCPVCGNFLVNLLFLIWLPGKCYYCKTNMITGDLIDK